MGGPVVIRRRSRGDGNSVLPLVMIVVLLGAFSLAAGYLGGQYLLRGFTRSVDAPADPGDSIASPGDMETLQWPGLALDVYRVQAGAFGEVANARELAQTLRELGYAATVIPSADGWNRVIADVTSTREEAERIASTLQGEGLEEVAALSWSVGAPDLQMQTPADSRSGLEEMMAILADIVHMQSGLHQMTDQQAEMLREMSGQFTGVWHEVAPATEEASPELYSLIDRYVLPNVSSLEESVTSSAAREAYLELLGALNRLGGG